MSYVTVFYSQLFKQFKITWLAFSLGFQPGCKFHCHIPVPIFMCCTYRCSATSAEWVIKGTILGTFHLVACLQMRKLRHRGTQDVCLAWYLMGSRAGMEGATGLFASKPSFLYHSTSKQEGLTVTTQNPAVRFWTLLTCQSLFWVKNSHCSFSVDPDLYSAMKTEGLLTICSPRALSWESSWPLLTSLSFSVLP